MREALTDLSAMEGAPELVKMLILHPNGGVREDAAQR
jgi:hypothetical protein